MSKWWMLGWLVLLIGSISLSIAWMHFARARIRDLLVWGSRAFKEEGLDYWIDYGTLLGLKRGSDVILWDNDADFCVLESPDLDAKLWKIALRLSDYGIVWTRVAEGIYRFYHRCLPVLVHADVDVFKLDGDMLRGPEGPKSDIPSSLIGSRPQVVNLLKGAPSVEFQIPEKVHETLVWRYGEDYMIPRPFFKGRAA